MQKSICMLLFLLLLPYSQNAYSSLELSASDQQNRPLEGASFSLSCPFEEPVDGPTPENTGVCTTGNTGMCKSKSCFGCTKGSTARITAKFYAEKQEKTSDSWTGAEKAFGYGCAGPQCCSWFDSLYALTYNFEFETSDINALVLDEYGNPLENASLELNVPGALFKSCRANSGGICKFIQIPRGANYGITAKYLDETESISGTADREKIEVNLTLSMQKEAGQGQKAGQNQSLPFSQAQIRTLTVSILGTSENWEIEVQEKNSNYLQRGKNNGTFELGEAIPYEIKVQKGGAAYYSQIISIAENKTLFLSPSQFTCGSSCLACGCKTAEICSISPIDATASCCPYGKRFMGAQKGCQSTLPFKIYFVPINVPANYSHYLKVVESHARELEKHLNIGYENYVLVDEPLYTSSCGQDTPMLSLISRHFKNWYKKTVEFEKERAPNNERNRVIGIDLYANCGGSNSCGFTHKRSYSPSGDPLLFNILNMPAFSDEWINAIYINAYQPIPSPMMKAEKIGCGATYRYTSLHELGHTFGLCDEYHPDTWEKQNARNPFSPCPNGKPNALNSDLNLSRCSASEVCASGVFESGAYSIMGDASYFDFYGNRIKREFTSKSKEQIKKVLEVATR